MLLEEQMGKSIGDRLLWVTEATGMEAGPGLTGLWLFTYSVDKSISWLCFPGEMPRDNNRKETTAAVIRLNTKSIDTVYKTVCQCWSGNAQRIMCRQET